MSKVTKQFQTEVQQLLDLVIHSLYSHKDIFLRELISNASDAVDKLRFEAHSNESLLEGNADWKVKLIPDKDAVFAELHRVLEPGGRIQLADVTIQRPVSEEGRRNIDLWTG